MTQHDDFEPSADLMPFQGLVQRDVDYRLARYADLGVLRLSKDKKTVELKFPKGRVVNVFAGRVSRTLKEALM